MEGSHCYCCGFDDVYWEAIKYTSDELIKLCKEKIKYMEEQKER